MYERGNEYNGQRWLCSRYFQDERCSYPYKPYWPFVKNDESGKCGEAAPYRAFTTTEPIRELLLCEFHALELGFVSREELIARRF